jgi:hypothetical protein
MLPGMAGPPALPEGMSLSITKEGKSPAKIVVKQGDKKWETTEDHLDKLPEKVRPAVERMLGRGPMGIGTFTVPVPPPGEFNTPLGVPREFHPLPDVERRLQDMNRQIEELRRSIRDLRQERRQSRERQPEKPVEKSPAHTEHI